MAPSAPSGMDMQGELAQLGWGLSGVGPRARIGDNRSGRRSVELLMPSSVADGRRPRRRPSATEPSDALSPAQHGRVKRAHHPYEYTQYQRREAAAREARRCICEMDPAVRPGAVLVTPGHAERRRDPARLAEPLQQVYALLLGMLDVAQRNATNWILYVAHTSGQPLTDLPGLPLLLAIAARRLPLRRGDVIDLIAQLHAAGVTHPRAPRQPERRAIHMDAAGAHMRPACPHSELWRCTRPMSAVLRYHAHHGHWPADLAPFGGHDQTAPTAQAPPKRRRRQPRERAA